MQFSELSLKGGHRKIRYRLKPAHIWISVRTHTHRHKQTHAVRAEGDSEKCRHGSYGSCAPRGLHLVQSGNLLFTHTHGHTYTHTHPHTCQLHLLREPTEHCWAKMGLATESLEDSQDRNTWSLCLAFLSQNIYFMLYHVFSFQLQILDTLILLKEKLCLLILNCFISWSDGNDWSYFNFK